MKDNIYEADLKELILNKKHVFIKDSNIKSVVLFEKGITVNSVIADCLIFTEQGEIIGVEIKSAHDTTRRLNKQLNSYSQVCDKVYVLIDDSHIDKVEEILNKNKHHHVGIISYTAFRGEPILGVYKEATKSPFKNLQTAYMSLLWKEELNQVLGSFKRQVSTLSELGLNVGTVPSRGATGINGLYVQSNASKRLRKADIANMIVNRLGNDSASRLLCNIYINNKLHPEHNLKFQDFRKK